ncbi:MULTISPECIES: TetR/AcrR family transcriptional regulator [unclassified Streptomyces]|uniref:TetR/AcrR family transcriptional regulator n=1 Tax=unclassified Streptomyces TaxID=2593676 RepID=UPI0036D1A841
MGRPRAFDEGHVIRAAAELFAAHGYEGTSIDDLVNGLGVHRGSLYKVFGSKRGLYLSALRTHVEEQVRPLVTALASSGDLAQALASAAASYDSGPAAGLLLLAAVERAPHDPEIAELVAEAFQALDQALADFAPPELAPALTATVLGARIRNQPGPVVHLARHIRPTGD